MEEYKSNSHKSKEARRESQVPEKRVSKVISGTAKTKKKSDINKIADVFISEDVSNVKSYIIMDVLVPAIKKAVSDIVTNGIDMILYGESGGSRKNSTASKISYNRYYGRDDDRRRDRSATYTRSGYSYDDVVLDTRGEAEAVLNQMDEIMNTYGMVSVADLYDLVGVTADYTAIKYGWTNIRNASIVRTRDGYLIKMPKAIPID